MRILFECDDHISTKQSSEAEYLLRKLGERNKRKNPLLFTSEGPAWNARFRDWAIANTRLTASEYVYVDQDLIKFMGDFDLIVAVPVFDERPSRARMVMAHARRHRKELAAIFDAEFIPPPDWDKFIGMDKKVTQRKAGAEI